MTDKNQMPDEIWAYTGEITVCRYWTPYSPVSDKTTKYIRADKYKENLETETKALRDHCDYLEGELNKKSDLTPTIPEDSWRMTEAICLLQWAADFHKNKKQPSDNWFAEYQCFIDYDCTTTPDDKEVAAVGCFDPEMEEYYYRGLCEIREIYCNMEGFTPETAPEAYVLQEIKKMYDTAVEFIGNRSRHAPRLVDESEQGCKGCPKDADCEDYLIDGNPCEGKKNWFKCDQCEKLLPTENGLEKHKRYHVPSLDDDPEVVNGLELDVIIYTFCAKRALKLPPIEVRELFYEILKSRKNGLKIKGE